MNIKFNYLYRDAANYKSFNSIIFGNPSSIELKIIEEEIIKNLIDKEYFIPQKCNVPLINKFTYDSELDHDWYEFESVEFTEEAAEEFTIDEFLNNINNFLCKPPTASTTLFSQKDLILKLLKEDLSNYLLVSGLEKTGLTAYPFFSDLGTLVLQLMGFSEAECDDALYQLYEKELDKVTGISIYNFPEVAEGLAEEIYEAILAERVNSNRKQ